MITQLTLKNFRRHEDLTIQFGAGLNVLRGANEAGKSTVIEGVLYALYGAKALRNKLAECVTWGKKEGDLSVELKLVMKGTPYTFKRSKAGATVVAEGSVVHVTGQNEVTAFAADLLGADPATASMLMLSSQSGLRGALDDGPAAVSGLMSKLADFDMIDRIVEAAQATLLLGSDGPVREKLVLAQEQLDRQRANAPQVRDALDIQREADAVVSSRSEHEQSLLPVVKAAFEKAEAECVAAHKHNDERKGVEDSLAQTTASIEQQRQALSSAQAQASAAPDPEETQRMREELQRMQTQAGQAKAYEAFLRLRYPEDFWEGTVEAFRAEHATIRDDLGRAQIEVLDVKNQIAALESTKIKGGTCPTCGHAAFDDQHVAEHNAKVDRQAWGLGESLNAAQLRYGVWKAKLSAYDSVDRLAQAFVDEASKILNHLEWDDNFYPPKVTWKGEPPDQVFPDNLKREIAEREAQERRAWEASGRVDAIKVRLRELDTQRSTLGAQLAAMPPIDMAPLNAAYSQAAADLNTVRAEIDRLLQQERDLEVERRESERAIAEWQRLVKVFEDQVAGLQADLEALAFNNVLVKKLRGLKPAITDHLWGTVLAAVSNFFSTLRGEKSVVTKDNTGFRVNGQSVESLSGSTLDVLALAIRVALTKTFVPHAGFIVLDEPAHGADKERTSNILGFLSSVGFEQTLLASHDELSEAVADNVIVLES